MIGFTAGAKFRSGMSAGGTLFDVDVLATGKLSQRDESRMDFNLSQNCHFPKIFRLIFFAKLSLNSLACFIFLVYVLPFLCIRDEKCSNDQNISKSTFVLVMQSGPNCTMGNT